MLWTVIAALPLCIWIYLAVGRGGFWRIGRLVTPLLPPATARVAVVIPARDEAAVIGPAIESLLSQDFPAPLHIYLVDDGSSDGTAEVARTAALGAGKPERVTIMPGEPLPADWTGKLWAMNQGVKQALASSPEYLLFTDADIVHARRSVTQLVALANAHQIALASHMVKLACRTTAEKALIPAFVFFFLKLYPPAWISSPRSSTAGAAGGCVLIRPEALEKIGGLASIRGEVIDDCSLARAVKRSGGRVWLGLTPDTHSIRGYGTFTEIGRMIARTAFNQLQHSALLLAGTVLGLFFTYLLPPLLVCLTWHHPVEQFLGAAAWAIMALLYLPTIRFYHRSVWWTLALPAIAAFYLGATIYSALQYWRGAGGAWKGRVQDARSSP